MDGGLTSSHTVGTPDPPPADDVWALVHGQPCCCDGGASMPPHPLAHLQPARAQEDVSLYRAALVARPGPALPVLPPAAPAPSPTWGDGEARLDHVQELLANLHALMLAVLRLRMQRDQVTPLLFRARGVLQGLRQYPHQQLVGPPPCPPWGLVGVTLGRVTEGSWPWEVQFLADLLAWLGALVWADEVGTVSFLELAMDFEAHAGRALPAAPQAAFRGTSLPLQERARVLRLALTTLGKLVRTGCLYPARMVTRCAALVPLGGPLLCGLSRRPYFACREAMLHHVSELATYCEARIVLGTARRYDKRPSAYRPRRTADQVAAARMARALDGPLSVALMPSSASAPPPMAKGGSGGNFCGDLYPRPLGGKGSLLPFQLLRPARPRKRPVSPPPPPAPEPAPGPPRDPGLCGAHGAAVCLNCLRFRRAADDCCGRGHHEEGHVPRRPALEMCEDHRLPACEACVGRGVRHCCPLHHCRPRPSKRPRPSAPPRPPRPPPRGGALARVPRAPPPARPPAAKRHCPNRRAPLAPARPPQPRLPAAGGVSAPEPEPPPPAPPAPLGLTCSLELTPHPA